MGRPKALLYVEGQTFLGRTLQVLEAGGVDDIAIVTGAHDDEIRLACAGLELAAGVQIVANPQFAQGQLSSIRAGLDALAPHHAGAVVVALIDHPFVRATTIASLVAAFHVSRAPVVRPSFDGRHGHPVLFSAEVFDALRSAPLEGGARTVVHASAERVQTVPVDDPGVVLDIDTPEDYDAAMRLMGFQPVPCRF